MKRAVWVLVLLCGNIAPAQSPRFAISTHLTSINTRDRIAGVGATFGYNFHRRLTMEATLNGFPGNPRNSLGRPIPPPILGGWRSGNVLQGQFGLRADLFETRKADFFLTAKPGFVRFSHLLNTFQPGIGGIGLGTQTIDLGRQICFAPFFGAGSQVYLNDRMFFRFDAGSTVIRYAPFRTTMNIVGVDPAFAPIIQFTGSTSHTFQFNTGFGFRFGGRR